MSSAVIDEMLDAPFSRIYLILTLYPLIEKLGSRKKTVQSTDTAVS